MSVTESRQPPDMVLVTFILSIASEKGSAIARQRLDAIEKDMSHYRRVIDNQAGLDKEAIALALNAEALKFCNNDVLPVNVPLVEELYRKSYEVNSSAPTACKLGMVYLRDYFHPHHFTKRPVDQAVYWLKIAHQKGCLPATRRLAELFACDPDQSVCNGELAVFYATAYAKTRPSDDYEALQLLACAHARNGNFIQAKIFMEEAVEQYKIQHGQDSWSYQQTYQQFKKGEVHVEYSRYFSERRSFADYVRVLDNA